MIEIGVKDHLLSDSSSNFVNLYKEQQIMLGLHLVLVTLHGWFTSIEQDNNI